MNPEMSLTSALGTSVLGFGVVFFVLVVLMIMITVLRSVGEQVAASKAGSAAVTATPVAAASVAPAANMVPAKGSLGDIKLFDVDDRTAALIMAIVADEMDAPLNELRFHSIREKK